MYFAYSGPPPLANVLARNLITVVTFTVFLIFAVGLTRMLRAAGGGDPGLAGSVAPTALLGYVVVTVLLGFGRDDGGDQHDLVRSTGRGDPADPARPDGRTPARTGVALTAQSVDGDRRTLLSPGGP